MTITGKLTFFEVSPELQELLDRIPDRERMYRHVKAGDGVCWDCWIDKLLYGESFYNGVTGEHYPVQDMVRVLAPNTTRRGLPTSFRSHRVEGS